MAIEHLGKKLAPSNKALECESAVIVTFVGSEAYSLVFAGDVPAYAKDDPKAFAAMRLTQAKAFIEDNLPKD